MDGWGAWVDGKGVWVKHGLVERWMKDELILLMKDECEERGKMKE